MTYSQQKKILLGMLAALAPLPLPFNQIVGWPPIVVFWVVVGMFIYRTQQGEDGCLPNWAMNLLGLIYLPILYLDLVVFWGGAVMRPLVHLALFSLGVKLLAVRRDKDKWHAFLIIFSLFLASMGTSVHPSVVLFLVAFLALSLLVLTRFASFHVLGTHRTEGLNSGVVPVRGFVTGATLLALCLAVPLFTLLPRLQRPLVAAPGVGSASLVQLASFSDTISLDSIGRVRTNRNVAMRLDYDRPVGNRELRFKAAVYDRYQQNTWGSSEGTERQIQPFRDGFYHVGQDRAESWVEVWQESIDGKKFALPVEAARVETEEKKLSISSKGTLALTTRRPGTLYYRVGLAREIQASPTTEEDREAAQDISTISARLAELAKQAMGEGSEFERAQRLEQYLATNFEYTLDLLGRRSDQVLDDFLFTLKKGHCEYFASSMVMMLRSEGIPARFVTGFLGAEPNPIEGYYVVRQSNAHAWVEAYLPDRGWTVFDPTPASGRPEVEALTLSNLLSQSLDFLVFRWDRYVLTFGFDDQVSAFIKLREWWKEFWPGMSRARSGPGSKPRDPENTSSSEPIMPSISSPSPVSPRIGILLVGLSLMLGTWFWWRDLQSFSATRAYRILRARARSADPALIDSVPPEKVASRLAAVIPEAADPLHLIVNSYLQESFGDRKFSGSFRMGLRDELFKVLRELKLSRRITKKSER